MKKLFTEKSPLLRGIVMLCVLMVSLQAMPARSQEQEPAGADSHQTRYGICLGFTESRIDPCPPSSGWTGGLIPSSAYAHGLRIATILDFRLGRCFSLRVMPGVTTINHSFEPASISNYAPQNYKVESVCGEMPIDVKFHPFRMGRFEPYFSSGLCYGFNFASLRSDISDANLARTNPDYLRFTCGLGVDCDARYLRIGLDLKAGFGLLPTTLGNANTLQYKTSPTFCIGLTFEG